MAKYLFRAQILHLDEILVVAVDDEKFSYHCRKQSIAFNLEVYLFLTTFKVFWILSRSHLRVSAFLNGRINWSALVWRVLQ